MGQERAGAEWQSSNNSRYNAAECRKMLRRRNVLLFIIVQIEEMNIFTAESLNELLREAEKIMEGWTDYR